MGKTGKTRGKRHQNEGFKPRWKLILSGPTCRSHAIEALQLLPMLQVDLVPPGQLVLQPAQVLELQNHAGALLLSFRGL